LILFNRIKISLFLVNIKKSLYKKKSPPFSYLKATPTAMQRIKDEEKNQSNIVL